MSDWSDQYRDVRWQRKSAEVGSDPNEIVEVASALSDQRRELEGVSVPEIYDYLTRSSAQKPLAYVIDDLLESRRGAHTVHKT